MDIAPSKIDLGRLGSEYLDIKDNKNINCKDFTKERLEDLIGSGRLKLAPKDIVLFGFGRNYLTNN